MPRPAATSRFTNVAAILCIAGLVPAATAQSTRIFVGAFTQIGSAADDLPTPRSVKTGYGPFYFAGSTRGVLGTTNQGEWDVFVRREASGPIWTLQFGSPQDDFALAIDHHALGGGVEAYIAGCTAGALEPGAHLGGLDAFVTRYDRDGNRVWLRQFGTPQDDVARDVVHDQQNGFYIVGSTSGDLGGASAGGDDAFLARYDSDGQRLWMRQFGGAGDDSASAVYPMWSGGAFIAGMVTNASSGLDAFLARYDGDGNRVWYREFGSSGDDLVSAVAVGPAAIGEVLTIGGSTTGDLGSANAGATDAWLARYDLDGNRLWITQFGTPAADTLLAIDVVYTSGIFATGSTEGVIGPYPINAGGADAFLAFVDAAGTVVGITQFGTAADDAATNIAFGRVEGYTGGHLGSASNGGRDIFHVWASVGGCYPDCDGSHWFMLNVDDFICFINEFASAQGLPPLQQRLHYVNCDQSSTPPVLNVDDFMCFINEFAAGCR